MVGQSNVQNSRGKIYLGLGNTGEHIIPLKRNIIDDVMRDIVYSRQCLQQNCNIWYVLHQDCMKSKGRKVASCYWWRSWLCENPRLRIIWHPDPILTEHCTINDTPFAIRTNMISKFRQIYSAIGTNIYIWIFWHPDLILTEPSAISDSNILFTITRNHKKNIKLQYFWQCSRV